MSSVSEKQMKIMRSTIMAAAIKERNWDYDTLHDLMESWGFGNSLRKLSYGELVELLKIIRNQKEPGECGIEKLDAQGRYMWSLMKQAGWNFYRLRMWMIKHCSASHWNALSDDEKRSVIAMLKNYVKKQQENPNKGEQKNEKARTKTYDNPKELGRSESLAKTAGRAHNRKERAGKQFNRENQQNNGRARGNSGTGIGGNGQDNKEH
mgnify:CR=1 FL=1